MNTKTDNDLREPGYKFTYTTTEVKTYEDGFAEGYSRAWIECWEHMRQIAIDASPPSPTQASESQTEE